MSYTNDNLELMRLAIQERYQLIGDASSFASSLVGTQSQHWDPSDLWTAYRGAIVTMIPLFFDHTQDTSGWNGSTAYDGEFFGINPVAWSTSSMLAYLGYESLVDPPGLGEQPYDAFFDQMFGILEQLRWLRLSASLTGYAGTVYDYYTVPDKSATWAGALSAYGLQSTASGFSTPNKYSAYANDPIAPPSANGYSITARVIDYTYSAALNFDYIAYTGFREQAFGEPSYVNNDFSPSPYNENFVYSSGSNVSSVSDTLGSATVNVPEPPAVGTTNSTRGYVCQGFHMIIKHYPYFSYTDLVA